jgi:hypothetical protein
MISSLRTNYHRFLPQSLRFSRMTLPNVPEKTCVREGASAQ